MLGIDNYYFIVIYSGSNLKKYYLTSEIVEQYSLREGDKVEGTYAIDDNNLYVVNTITKINNLPASEFLQSRKDLEIDTAIFSTEKTTLQQKGSLLT